MKLERRGTEEKGFGVFAARPFKAGEVLLSFEGERLPRSRVPTKLEPEEDHYLQIGENLFLGPSGLIDDFVNHSCDPNCKVTFEYDVTLVAMRNIAAGEEVTFDYSTTSTDTPETWSLRCRCNGANCRGLVSGFRTLPKEVRDFYITKSAAPLYVR